MQAENVNSTTLVYQNRGGGKSKKSGGGGGGGALLIGCLILFSAKWGGRGIKSEKS